MKKSIVIAAVTALIGFTANSTFAQTDTTKKADAAPATQTAAFTGDVVAALNSNADYSTAAQAVKAANLEPLLKAGGPYTIFAPNNEVFSKLPAGRLDSLLKDTTKLATLLKGHIVSGKYAKADIIKTLTDGKGKATLTTLAGQPLTLSISGGKLLLTNTAGNSAQVVLYDLVGSNGVVNGINSILMPDKMTP